MSFVRAFKLFRARGFFAPRRTFESIVKNAEKCSEPKSRGLIVGVYSNESDRFDPGYLTPAGARYNESVKGRLLELLRVAGPMPKRGECRTFYSLENNFSAVVVCGLGEECAGFNKKENIDEGKENIRTAAAVGCQTLQHLSTSQIFVETFGNAEAAAEGANLGLWANHSFRMRTKADIVPQIHMYTERGVAPDTRGWKIGAYKAEAQNLARTLMEAPANLMTPTMFAQQVVQILCQSGVNVEVKVRGWAESQGMEPFLTVARGSCEPPIFLELSYYGTDYSERPIVLIGQGNTYDSGGICLKTYKQLNNMRGDMAGAAIVVAACKAISALKLPINVRGLIPLCENMIGCNAFKPGDVIKANNGMTIEVESTDNEEPIVMVDALLYAKNFWPKCIIDVGTMHPDLITALGTAASAVYTNSEQMWQGIKHASVHTGDRVWKFPLWNYFTEQITSANTADVQNVGSGEGGGACKAAAFLREFISCGPWMHIDASSVMTTDGTDIPYLKRGMAGRPTRTLIEFIAQSVTRNMKFEPTVTYGEQTARK